MNEKLRNTINWLLERLSENSTWRGIILTLTGLGIYIEPTMAAQITAVGLAIVGLINIIRQGAPSKSAVTAALESKVDKPGAPQPPVAL